jgi:hypothetical protein
MATLDSLTEWVRQNAVIDINREYAIVTVDFSNNIMEWHNPMELAYFVAELFPLRAWLSVGFSPDEDHFQVSAWWCSDEYVEACKQKGNGGDELLLTPEGRERLADCVKHAMQGAVAGDDTFDWDLGGPVGQGRDCLLYIPQPLFDVFGEKAMTSLILTQYPGYAFDKLFEGSVDEFAAVLLRRAPAVKIAA